MQLELNLKNVFYFYYINDIGGVESFFYYLIQNLQDYDVTIVYDHGNEAQLNRFKKFARVIKWNPSLSIKCDKLFLNYNIDMIDKIDAQEYIEILHADYKALNITPHTHPKISKYIGVSQLVCDSFTELTGLPAECIYNPITLEKPNKILHLISATRLTPEKGKNRMAKLMELLDASGIKYTWTVFTNDTGALDSPNIIWRKPTLSITDWIADADYLVQLSDSEGYGYSIVEALTLGTPVIVTDMQVMHEIGVEHEVNGFILKHDLSNIDIDKIYSANLKFNYKPKKSTWDKLVVKGLSDVQLNKRFLVKALPIYKTRKIKDLSLGRIPQPGEVFEVDYDRLNALLGDNSFNKPFVKIIERLD